MPNRRNPKNWLIDKFSKLFDEIVAGVLIALVISGFSSGWVFLRGKLSGLVIAPEVWGIGSMVIIGLALVLIVVIWRARSRWQIRSNKSISIQRRSNNELFVGRENEIKRFKAIIQTNPLSKNAIWVSGIGGMGKSTLLAEYEYICQKMGFVTAKISCDEQQNVIDVLRNFADQLRGQGITLKAFRQSIGDYQNIQNKLKEQSSGITNFVKVATTIAESSGHPVISSTAKAIGPETAGQLAESFRNWLTNNEEKFYENPDKTLTSSFIKDICEVNQTDRVVFFFDTFEQAGNINSWVFDNFINMAQPHNILTVIAGRNPLPSLIFERPIEDIRLKEMNGSDAMAFLERYQKSRLQQMIPHAHLEKIAEFSNGLPLALAMSMHVVGQHAESQLFDEHSQEIIPDLVNRITREVTFSDGKNILEVCAVLRWFNQDTLCMMLDDNKLESIYAKLVKFPFVRSRREGLALHDSVRDWINQDLSFRSPKTWTDYHQKAARYYAQRIEILEGQHRKFEPEWQDAMVNMLYHKFQGDDIDSLEFLQMTFEEAQINNPSQMRIIWSLADNSERFAIRYKKWVKYYEVRITLYEIKKKFPEMDKDENIKAEAQKVIDECIKQYRAWENDAEMKLYVRTSLGIILFRQEQVNEAIRVLEKNLELSETDFETLSPADHFQVATTKRYLATFYRIVGNYHASVKLIEGTNEPRMQVELARSYYFLGKFRKSEQYLKECLRLFEKFNYPERYSALALRYLIYVYYREGKFQEAISAATQMENIGQLLEDEFTQNLARYNLAVLNKNYAQLRLIIDRLIDESKGDLHRKTIIPRGIMLLAQHYLDNQKVTEARHYIFYALCLSRQSKYMTGILRGILGICELFYLTGKSERVNARAEKVEGLCKPVNEWNQLSRFRVIQGKAVVAISKKSNSQEFQTEQLGMAYQYFTDAMCLGLKFNRYILDIILGKIIAFCQEEPVMVEFGMINQLSNYWKTTTLDGISLIQLEKEARDEEPGDGKPQTFVLEQIERRLKSG